MSTSTETQPEKLDIPGSCHCGTVQFIAHNVDLSKAIKCNCSICLSHGRIGISLPPRSITITSTPSGNPVVLGYDNGLDESLWPAELKYYSPALFQGKVEKGNETSRHYFCGICGVNPFIIANLPAYGGELGSVNAINLDLKRVGKDLKDLSNPKTMKYARGSDNTWETAVGEPWPHSMW